MSNLLDTIETDEFDASQVEEIDAEEMSDLEALVAQLGTVDPYADDFLF